MNDQVKGLIITTLGVLFVVPDALFIRLIDAETLVIAFWRLFLSSGIVLLWQLFRHGASYPDKIKIAGPYGLVYAFFAALSAILFVTAVQKTTVANTVLIIASLPAFAAFFSWLLLGERLSKRMIWTMCGAFAGIAIIAYGSSTSEAGNLVGDGAALLVAMSFALGITGARKAAPASMLPLVPVGYGGASLILLLFIDPFNVPSEAWPLVLLHGGFFIAFSTTLLAIGPRYITTAEVGLLILLESILAPLLVWAILKEEPGGYALVGGAVLIITLVWSNIIALRRAK